MVVKINSESELRITILLTVLSSSSNCKILNIKNAISKEKLRQNRQLHTGCIVSDIIHLKLLL